MKKKIGVMAQTYINITRQIKIARTARKINNDLEKISKTFGDTTDVQGDLIITYIGISRDIFYDALEMVVNYDNKTHSALVKCTIEVKFLLKD